MLKCSKGNGVAYQPTTTIRTPPPMPKWCYKFQEISGWKCRLLNDLEHHLTAMR